MASTRTMSRGLFILFEGLDRCGKTTQVAKLAEVLQATGSAVTQLRFPGALINAYLRKEAELDDRSIHLIFSANRWERRAQIEDALERGDNVVCDRYAYSGVAFSSAKTNMPIEWCQAPDSGLPMPDIIFFLSLDAEEAGKRPGFGGERYETPEFQAAVRSRFAAMRSALGGKGVWFDIDAKGSIEDVHARVMDVVRTVRAAHDAEYVPIRRLWKGETDLVAAMRSLTE